MQAPPNDQSGQMCTKCQPNRWKPDRAHHCQYCNRCILKMDHHCPWVANCVGHHNYKPFYLFCFYEMLAGMCYFYLLMCRLFGGKAVDAAPLSVFGTISYYITNIITMPICFALIGMNFAMFMQLYDNVTTIESMKHNGPLQRRLPCIGVPPAHEKVAKVNQWDMLWPNNLAQVFGSNMLSWGIPFWMPEMAGWGMYFPKLPTTKDYEVGLLQRDGQNFRIYSFDY